MEYLCKKRPGDIVNKRETQKQVMRKVRYLFHDLKMQTHVHISKQFFWNQKHAKQLSVSSKKVVSLLDDVKTTACLKTTLLGCDPKLLEKFLEKHPELAEPINKIMKSDIQNLLSPLPFLQVVKDTQLRLLAAMCRYEAYDANQIVFEEHSKGSKLFIVLDGEANILSHCENSKTNKDNDAAEALCRSLEIHKQSSTLTSSTTENGMIKLATLGTGDYFGETALIVDVPRTTTVKTTTKCLFVTVDKTDFANFFKVCPIREDITRVTIERMLCKLSMLGIPFLYGIPEEKLKTLVGSAKLEEYKTGDVVFKQGDHGDRFYIIVHGQVKIETNRSSQSTDIGRLGAGQYFGEMALVQDKKRSATVSSYGNEKSVLLSIDKKSFHKIFASNELALLEFELRVLKFNIELFHLLSHPNGMSIFQEFLEASHAGENLEFWTTVKDFETKFKRLLLKDITSNTLGEKYEMSDSENQTNDNINEGFNESRNNGENMMQDHEKDEMDDIWEDAKKIFTKFCDEHATREINIPHDMRKKLRSKIFEREDGSNLPSDVFSAPMKEVYKIMDGTNFPRFKTSPGFKVSLSCFFVKMMIAVCAWF